MGVEVSLHCHAHRAKGAGAGNAVLGVEHPHERLEGHTVSLFINIYESRAPTSFLLDTELFSVSVSNDLCFFNSLGQMFPVLASRGQCNIWRLHP